MTTAARRGISLFILLMFAWIATPQTAEAILCRTIFQSQPDDPFDRYAAKTTPQDYKQLWEELTVAHLKVKGANRRMVRHLLARLNLNPPTVKLVALHDAPDIRRFLDELNKPIRVQPNKLAYGSGLVGTVGFLSLGVYLGLHSYHRIDAPQSASYYLAALGSAAIADVFRNRLTEDEWIAAVENDLDATHSDDRSTMFAYKQINTRFITGERPRTALLYYTKRKDRPVFYISVW